jgi:hypothetical protein
MRIRAMRRESYSVVLLLLAAVVFVAPELDGR